MHQIVGNELYSVWIMTSSFKGWCLLFWQAVQLLKNHFGSVRLGSIMLWQISFGFELRTVVCPLLYVTISIKRGHSMISSIEKCYCSANFLHSDWAGTPVSSKTSGPLISAHSFQLLAFQQAISASLCEQFPEYVQLNAWPIIYEELPHRCLGSSLFCYILLGMLPHKCQVFPQHGTLIHCFLSPEIQPTLLPLPCSIITK